MRIKPALIIKTFKENASNANLTAKILGIHQTTVYRWILKAKCPYPRNKELSTRNLNRKSTKPKTITYATSKKEYIDIINLRKETGFCAEKIKNLLELNASRNTIHRILVKERLINNYANHIRPRYQKTTHMNLKNTKTIGFLQMDVKYVTPELSGLPWTCFEYAVIDIYSRYKEAVILNQHDQSGSILALIEILPKLPFKSVFIQTDNGFEFQGRFHDYVRNMDMEHHFIHKSTPNENAVIERSFRTDEEEFFFRLEEPCKDYDDLRVKFAEYLRKYNTWRPHLGINLKRPIDVVANVLGH